MRYLMVAPPGSAHSFRCKRCKFGGASKEGGGWCYKNPKSNGGFRQWIDQDTYNAFVALLGCASFELDTERY